MGDLLSPPHLLVIEPVEATAMGLHCLCEGHFVVQRLATLEGITPYIKADMVLLSADVSPEALRQALTVIQQCCENTPLVLYSMQAPQGWDVQTLLCYQVHGWLSKLTPIDQLLRQLNTVMGGGLAFCEPFLAHLKQRRTPDNPLDVLWVQEVRVLKRMSMGWGKGKIADDLGIAVKTVQKYQTQILDKLKVDSAFGLLQRPLVDALEQWCDEDMQGKRTRARSG